MNKKIISFLLLSLCLVVAGCKTTGQATFTQVIPVGDITTVSDFLTGVDSADLNLVFDPINPPSTYLSEIIRTSSHLESQNQVDADSFTVTTDNYGVIFDYVSGNSFPNPAAAALLTPYPPALTAGQSLVFVASPSTSIRHLVIISFDASALKQFVNWFLAQTSMPAQFSNAAVLYEDDAVIDSGTLSTLIAPLAPQIVVKARRTIPVSVEAGVEFPVSIDFTFEGGVFPAALGFKETLPPGMTILSGAGTVSNDGALRFALLQKFNGQTAYTSAGGSVEYTAQITQDADLSGIVEWSVDGVDIPATITDAATGAAISTITLGAVIPSSVCPDGTCDVDETSSSCPADCCVDLDNDGYSVTGGTCGFIDCNDFDSTISPASVEIPEDDIDQDCDGTDAVVLILCTDNDGDGFSPDGGTCGPIDCNDGLVGVFPGTIEDCTDNLDNNCDGLTDGQDASTCPAVPCTDNDGDGYGIGADIGQCTSSSVFGDCDDANGGINPGASENTNTLCFDGQDNNCDGNTDATDNGCTSFCDEDIDGAVKQGCTGATIDCDDTQGGNFPGNVERCDQLDNNCDGFADDGNVCAVPEPDDMYTNVASVRSKEKSAIIFIGPSGADRRDAAIGAGKMRVSLVGVSNMDPDQDEADICNTINSLDPDAEVIFGWGGKFALPLAAKYYCKAGQTPTADGCAEDIETESCEIRMFRDTLCGKMRKIVLVAGHSPTDTRVCTNVFKKQEQFQAVMANSQNGIKVKRKALDTSGDSSTVDVTPVS
ncbi:MAG: putative metal-binding motif-containing protein [Nanoarchaeota archaeon]|nr:putative metal-binding motif-containing protein [Nanoarchaeota archaeon]